MRHLPRGLPPGFLPRGMLTPILIALLATACGGGDDAPGSANGTPTGPNASCALTPPTGTMTAQLNGAAFTANFSTQATIQNTTALGPNIVQISGVGCVDGTATRVQQVLITIGRLTPITPGTYALDAAAQSQPPGSGYSGIGTYASAPNLWYTNLNSAAGAGSGTVTFTAITATRLAGTFSLVLAPAPGNGTGFTNRVTVSNGAFDISTR